MGCPDESGSYEHCRYDTQKGIEVIWALVSTGFIFFMQAGFALVETGCVRHKNAQSILIKNVFDSAIGCIGFYLVGYAFAFGNVNYFIGYNPKYFAASGFWSIDTDNYKWWIFQYSFAATAATIVSGSLAERCQLTTYICFSFFMTSFIYPVVVAWVWAENDWGKGWLKNLGYIDFAGSSVVHVVGGICALWGAKILGPRYGREKDWKRQKAKKRELYESVGMQDSVLFNDEEFHKVLDHVRGDYKLAFQEWIAANRKQEFKPHNPGLILTGTILLWVCWLFFNGGSAIIFSPRKSGAAKVIMNNLIAPASAALFAGYFKGRITGTYSYVEKYDVATVCNGIIVGLVASTASCDGTEPWASVIIGIVGALFYSIGVLLINKFGIDDPLEASPVHLGGGSWGTLCVGLFNQDIGLFYNPKEGIK